MPNLTPLQSDFSVGELSPQMLMRVDLESRNINIYQNAAKEVVNFITDSRGPLRSRDGFRYLGSAKGGAAPITYITQAFLTQLGALAQSRTSKSDDAYNNFEDPFITDTDLRNAFYISINRDTGQMATASNTLVAYSSDIDNWDVVNPGAGTGNIRQVIWDEFGNQWLAVNSHPSSDPAGIIIRQSPDLATWTTLYEDSSAAAPGANGIVADGQGNMLMCGNTTGSVPYAMHSVDNGVSWTYTDISSLYNTSGDARHVRYVNGFWFILGSTLSLLKSASPAGPWSSVMTGPLFDTVVDIAWGDGRYVCMRENNDGANQSIVHSTDAETWTNATYSGGAGSPGSPSVRSVVFDSVYRWCAVGNQQILISDDGITWTQAPQYSTFTSLSGLYLWEYPDV